MMKAICQQNIFFLWRKPCYRGLNTFKIVSFLNSQKHWFRIFSSCSEIIFEILWKLIMCWICFLIRAFKILIWKYSDSFYIQGIWFWDPKIVRIPIPFQLMFQLFPLWHVCFNLPCSRSFVPFFATDPIYLKRKDLS